MAGRKIVKDNYDYEKCRDLGDRFEWDEDYEVAVYCYCLGKKLLDNSENMELNFEEYLNGLLSNVKK